MQGDEHLWCFTSTPPLKHNRLHYQSVTSLRKLTRGFLHFGIFFLLGSPAWGWGQAGFLRSLRQGMIVFIEKEEKVESQLLNATVS